MHACGSGCSTSRCSQTRRPRLIPRSVDLAPDPLALEQVEEALGHGVVVAVAPPAHGWLHVVVLQERGPLQACKLAALIRMHQHAALRFAPPDGGEQSLQDDIGRLPGLHRPSDDAALEKVKHDRQVGEALVGADVGDVGHPGLVWRLGIEPAIERVVDGKGRLAAILAGTTLVADLRPDAGEPR